MEAIVEQELLMQGFLGSRRVSGEGTVWDGGGEEEFPRRNVEMCHGFFGEEEKELLVRLATNASHYDDGDDIFVGERERDLLDDDGNKMRERDATMLQQTIYICRVFQTLSSKHYSKYMRLKETEKQALPNKNY